MPVTSASLNKALQSNTGYEFLQGGSYKICYSDSGTFTNPNVDVWPATITVAGVFDDQCTSSDCLRTNKFYYCYILKLSYNNPSGVYESASTGCVVDYSGTGAGYIPDSSG